MNAQRGGAVALALVVVLGGCGSGETAPQRHVGGPGNPGQNDSKSPMAARHQVEASAKHASTAHVPHARHRRRQEQRLTSACPAPARTLNGVYHPERLSVLDPCRTVTGRVDLVRDQEEDGDLHFDVAVNDKGLLDPSNYSQQDGLLVVELMPRDHGHLPAPTVGNQVELRGAWVDDTEHGWNEVHPVFEIRINGGRWHRSGPRFGGSPPYTRSDDSLAACHTASGARCVGYNGVVAPPPERHEPAETSPPSKGENCDPAYPTVCISPPPPDLDCSEVPYTNFKVLPPDPHHFDSDGDGVGCES